MTLPLLPWDAPQDTRHPQLVWRSKLDDRYLIEVHRTGTNNYTGKLVVFDHDRNNQEIFSMDIGLSHGAIFGPDIADVDEWRDKVLDFIDNNYNKQ